MLNIRRAALEEAVVLTGIAVKSEAFWGFDDEYMEKFNCLYSVTEELINNNPTYLIEENLSIIGFYSIMSEENKVSLEYFFIEPKYIGKGYGKILWKHMVKVSEKIGIKELEIVTSPEAKGFYTKMGAVVCGEVESIVRKGRRIPRLIYRLKSSDS